MLHKVTKAVWSQFYPSRFFPYGFGVDLQRRQLWARALLNGRLLPKDYFLFGDWQSDEKQWDNPIEINKDSHPGLGKHQINTLINESTQKNQAVWHVFAQDRDTVVSGARYSRLVILDDWPSRELTIVDNDIRHLDIHKRGTTAWVSNCQIKVLNISAGIKARLILSNCTIGTLIIGMGSCRDLELLNCSVRRLQYEISTNSESPILDYSLIRKTWFARSIDEGAGPQHHVRKLWIDLAGQNQTLTAAVFHSITLALDRPTERAINKAVSWFYEFFSDYGNSIGRPLVWLVAMLLSMFLITWFADPLVPVDPKTYWGWQHDLVESPAFRALIYSGQSIFNPLSIFAKPLVVAKSPIFAAFGTAAAIIGVLLLGLFFVGVRRRFKLD